MDKFSRIKSSIDRIISLTNEEFSAFCDAIDVKTIAKNEFFLQEGQICDYIGLVNHGVLIYFKSLDNGNEITTDFAFEGDWVTVNQSRLNNSPSLINNKAIELLSSRTCLIYILKSLKLNGLAGFLWNRHI